ncbi:cytochrome P450 monooygenase 2 [Colletotrichum spaethianum]|uniref:Cytochrome P450 monooygenase 2 n=1 Tax=Colletotrichum spaethianum TaxID=700344 RepID=A0AA37PEK2_9PEZI|nr:cytochrome P450 monooygenase 2 [Colletotrichum spaethianum]GKT50856.1 cytochrome P450 monooygenase 2 [Colletotrichum spaethianum]
MGAIETPKHMLSTWLESSFFNTMDVWTSLCLGIILISILTTLPHMRKPSRKLPHINPRSTFDIFGRSQKLDFLFNARKILEKGRKKFPSQPYRLMTDVGETVVVPPEFVHDIRNEPGLSFLEAFANNFHPHLPGFEGFASGSRPDELLQTVIKKRITKLLKWREYHIKNDILDLISRLSSRVFLGAEVCRNEDWLAITKSYTLNAFLGAMILRPYPYWLRSIAHWFIPECKSLRQQVSDSKIIIEPVLQKRRDLRREAFEKGEPVPSFNDGIDWFEEESKGREYDVVGAQLGLSVVAIHTTTDLLVETMLRIAENPELFDPLRKEIVEVLSTDGWKKTALFNMKLMDSVLKESQRLKPITSAIINRVATRQVTLPNGLQLQKGESCVGDLGMMYDPSIYPDPETFDAYRFINMRGDAKLDSQAHLVSTSAAHLGFGHGHHACPGRFFASNELKVALSHLLMKYDWKLTPGYEHKWQEMGLTWSSDETAKLLMRKREMPEIDIDSLQG